MCRHITRCHLLRITQRTSLITPSAECTLSNVRERYILNNSHLCGQTEMGIKHTCKSIFFICMVFTVVFLFGFRSHVQDNAGSWNGINAPKGFNLLTIHTNQGRLGNQMFTFATLYGLGRLNHRSIALMPSNYEVLQKYFDISIFPLVDEKHFVEVQPWQIGNWLKEEDKAIPLVSNIVKGNIYPTSYTFFDHVREEIKELFRFSDKIKNDAVEFLRHVKIVRPSTEVYVGVHVRRGDYLSHTGGGWLRAFDGREVDFAFFQRAVDYFRNKYANVTFLAVSDDREWCRKNLAQFGILTTPDSPGPAEDLALLAECNHTIMTYGTYGFWGGYLAGGEVVYFTDFLKPNTSMTKDYFRYEKMYPPDWVAISTTPPGFWENYTNPFLT
ncbi:galactoside alpha-(1,2)-fucosyltransferase 2-like [Argiope bruennichi]|uniref:galactoside alpha-(1,2)-fucosyltransferase 2-like n=1 Tax=Argiope bruennichi TaxID=94029 RepID=UPI00249431D1|nr:galactoside alpha-(1,2)-fucosyltransferase 2-like [Argiope bruennichi]